MNKKGTRALMSNHLRQILTSKHSAEMTIGTLVVIVLAIIVLVVLALGFVAGWTNLWSKVTGFFSPVNVDATKQACQYACTTQSAYAYCCQIREVKFEKGQEASLMTCNKNDGKLGLEVCDISCSGVCGDLICATPKFVGVKVNENPVSGQSCLAASVDSTKKLDFSLVPITKDKVCCTPEI